MKTQLYNYRSGQQIIPNYMQTTIVNIIEETDGFTDKFNIRGFNKNLLSKLYASGWSDGFPLSVYSKIAITSIYNKIGLCIQTGNVARIYADLLKLQTLYTDEKINAGILVLPSKKCADLIGNNVANYERFLRELTYVFSKVITIPLLIVAFDNY